MLQQRDETKMLVKTQQSKRKTTIKQQQTLQYFYPAALTSGCQFSRKNKFVI